MFLPRSVVRATGGVCLAATPPYRPWTRGVQRKRLMYPSPNWKSLVSLLGMLVVISSASALEVTPVSPAPPHTLVRVKYTEGDSVAVVRLLDGVPSDVDVIDCQGQMGFTGAPGSAYLIVAMESGKLKLIGYQIANVPSPPTPPTPPVPPIPPDPPLPPGPDPDVPDGQYGLARYVRDLAAGLPASERALAGRLAANYEWGAGQVVAMAQAAAVERTRCVDGVCRVERYVPGTVAATIYEQVAAGIASRNRGVVTTDAWARAVGDPLHVRLNEIRRTDPTMRQLTGYATALREIAVGMGAVR